MRFHAADLRLLQEVAAAGDAGAGRREHPQHPGAGVGRAADDLDDTGAGLNRADAQTIGIGMGPRLAHAGHGKRSELAGRIGQFLHLEAEGEQPPGDLVGAGVGFEKLLQPAQCELHAAPPARVGMSSAAKP